VREGLAPPEVAANFGAYPIGALAGVDETIVVEPLDQMIDSLKPISLLKVDVEGSELDVLVGCQKLIARDRPALYVENDREEKSRELITYILDMNYELWWHIVPLFRPNNHAHTRANIFGNIRSFNMLCLPRERKVQVNGLTKIENPELHPLRKNATVPAAEK
jgi:hypothetical protein